jgi:hypothetical protein
LGMYGWDEIRVFVTGSSLLGFCGCIHCHCHIEL